MAKQLCKGLWCVSAILCLWALPAFSQTDLKSIKIKGEGASIHAAPDTTSKVIERPSAGFVYEMISKTGEWYKIKFNSRLGMIIPGFIHEKFVYAEKPFVEIRQDTIQVFVKEEPGQPHRAKNGYISIGSLYNHHMGHNYMYPWFIYYQNGAIYDMTENHGSLGFQLGLGLNIFENMEFCLKFCYTTTTLDGIYAMNLPNRQLASDIVYAQTSGNPGINEMIFDLGLNYHVSWKTRLMPYFGGGVSYIKCGLELLDQLIFSETFSQDGSHEVEITDLDLINIKMNALGFFGKAGVDISISESLDFYVEGQYLIANKKVPHPYATRLSGKEELLEINLGGVSVLSGVKINF